MKKLAILLALLLLCSCGEEARPPLPPQDANRVSGADDFVLLNGSCQSGAPVEDIQDYMFQYRAKENSLGFVRIRSNAAYDVNDLSNVLGTVPCGTILRGCAGVKNPSRGNAAGYRVLVKDSEGNKCRGYVSIAVVETVGRLD